MSCVWRREELASLNRSIQSTAKGIKSQLEGLSRDRAALPEPQQAKLRKLMQDFAAALQVRPDGTSCAQQQIAECNLRLHSAQTGAVGSGPEGRAVTAGTVLTG